MYRTILFVVMLWRRVALGALVVALVGCADVELPQCGAPEVLEVVNQIVDEAGLALARELVTDPESGRQVIDIRLEHPRMVGFDAETPLRQCQVDLVSEALDEVLEIVRRMRIPPRNVVTLDYHLLWTDDGDLWVQVYPWEA